MSTGHLVGHYIIFKTQVGCIQGKLFLHPIRDESTVAATAAGSSFGWFLFSNKTFRDLCNENTALYTVDDKNQPSSVWMCCTLGLNLSETEMTTWVSSHTVRLNKVGKVQKCQCKHNLQFFYTLANTFYNNKQKQQKIRVHIWGTIFGSMALRVR